MNYRRLLSALALALAMAAVACDPGPPDQTSAEAFVSDFARTLTAGWEGRYTAFYLKSGDFDLTRDGADMAVERMTGQVQAEFLRRCRNAHLALEGKNLRLEKLHRFNTQPRIVAFIRDLEEQYSDLVAEFSAGDEKLRIQIDELFKTGGQWRMTTFTLIFDTGTENLGAREIK